MIAWTDGQGDSYSGWDTPLLGLYQYIDIYRNLLVQACQAILDALTIS